MAFKNLHRDLLELFSEEAPTTYHAGAIRLRRTTAPASKRERDAAWKAANPARVQEHRVREFKRRKRLAAQRRAGAKFRATHPYVPKGTPRTGRPVTSQSPAAVYLRAWRLKRKASA